MLGAVARLADRRAWLVTALAASFAAVAGIFGSPVAGELHQGGFTDPGSESEAAARALADATGTRPDRNVMALVRIDDIHSAAARAEVEKVRSTIAGDPAIKAAFSYYETEDPSFVSRDGHQTLVLGLFGRVDDDAVAAAAVRLQRRLGSDPAVTLGGVAATFAEVQSTVQADLGRAEKLAFPILFLLMLWVFRGVAAALLPLMVGGVTVLGTFCGLRAVNGATPLSIFALNLATGLGLGLSIDYSLLMVSRFREQLAAGETVPEALRTTVATAGRTILFSSLTIMAAMATLMVFPLNFLFSMAVAGVIVVAIAASTALLLLPAVLRLLGTRINAMAPRHWQRPEASSRGFWYSLSRIVMRRPLPVALVSGTFMLLLGLPSSSIKFTYVDATVLPATAGARIVQNALEEDFPGRAGTPALVVVKAPPERAAEVSRLAGRIAGVAGVASVFPPQYVGSSVWRIDVQLQGGPYSDIAVAAVRTIRGLPLSPRPLVAGATASFLDLQRSLLGGLPRALALVASITLAILFLLTGSVVLPVKAVVMNLLTLSATFGALVLVFQRGAFQGLLAYSSSGALEQTQPVLLFALIFGLSTDYGVFLLSRIKEAREAGLPNDEAVALGLQRTGRIVSAAALLLCVAIGTFATSDIVFIKELGVGTVIGVLADSTVVRALLVPSLMGLLGDWNWWAPRRLHRLHLRLGLSEV